MEVENFLLREFKKRRADDVVLSSGTYEKLQLKFSNNKISVVQSWESESMEIFVAIKKKLIATSLKDISLSSAKEAVDEMMKFEKAVKPNEKYMGIAEGPFKYKKIEGLYDGNVIDLKDNASDMVEKCINSATSSGADRTAGIFEITESSTHLLTSNSVEAKSKGTLLYFSMRALANKEASGHKVCVSRGLQGFEPERISAEAAEIARLAENPSPLKAGKYDILFEPLAFANIIEHVGASASIFNVETGLSFLGGRLNKKIGSGIINLRDDATAPASIGSFEFDDEGSPTQNNKIIEKGILKKYLHNTSTARNYKTKTTANAGIVSPEPNNIIVENGNINKEEMIAKIKKGLLVTNVWYTRFQNHSTGDFSTIPRDGIFLIENGNIKKSVKDIRISDNVINILKSTVALGKKPEQILGWEIQTPTTTPHALVKGLKVTKSTDL